MTAANSPLVAAPCVLCNGSGRQRDGQRCFNGCAPDTPEVARIAAGLKPWVADAIRDAKPYGVLQHVVSVYAGVPARLTKGYVVATLGSPLNELGEAVRHHLLASKGKSDE